MTPRELASSFREVRNEHAGVTIPSAFPALALLLAATALVLLFS